MDWKTFKDQVEATGVKDEDDLVFVDWKEGFDEKPVDVFKDEQNAVSIT